MPRLLIQSLNAVAVAVAGAGRRRSGSHLLRTRARRRGAVRRCELHQLRHSQPGRIPDRDRHDVDRGRDLIERAIAAGAGFSTSVRHAQLADAYRKLGRLRIRSRAADRALSTCRTPVDCIDARAADGHAHLALGNETAALADQKEILAAVEKMHSTLAASDLLKQNFQRLWEEAYSLAIDLHFRRGEFREALEASELARSRAFSTCWRRVSSSAHRLNSAIGPARRATPPRARRFRSAARPTGPERVDTGDVRSEASVAPPTVEGLTAIAARLHSTLLAYWVGANDVYIWALSPDGNVRGASASIARAKLDELIRSTTPFTSPRETRSSAGVVTTRGEQQIAVSARSQRAWRALYDVLIAPIERELPAHSGASSPSFLTARSWACRLPRCATRAAATSSSATRSIRFPPAPCCSSPRRRSAPTRARGTVLLVGDPAGLPRIPGEPPLPRLAGASDEVRAIARLLPASRTTMLAGTAQPSRVFARAAGQGRHSLRDARHRSRQQSAGVVPGARDRRRRRSRRAAHRRRDLRPRSRCQPDRVERLPLGRRCDYRRRHRRAWRARSSTRARRR